ncbi:MAG TPA: J domain-containing protein [Pseudolabrys sp.]|jgi:DnaJ-class molecular chaperone|nr:J domain-containing protein [Pseudolabrys sp.]
MRDPYEVLGVSKSADAAQVKSAFRKLAKKLHPDANKHDPKAATRFAELNAAYEILGDDKKRKAFDNGEIDAEGKPRFRGFEGFGAQPGGGGQRAHFETWGPDGFQRGGGAQGRGGFEDILRDMFGGLGGARARGRTAQFETEDFAQQHQAPPARDLEAMLTISLEDAAKGATRRLHLPTGKEVDVRIPAGLTSGQQIRLKGQGYPSPWNGGVTGDAIITVNIAQHPIFTVDGNDLRLDLPVTLYEAVLGAKVRVPTLDGAVQLAIPANTTSGRTFRLKGKGLHTKSGTGDLLATVRIALPDGSDDELKELMRKWRESKAYNPRKDIE